MLHAAISYDGKHGRNDIFTIGGVLLIYGRIFGLYWNGIYAILPEGKHNNNRTHFASIVFFPFGVLPISDHHATHCRMVSVMEIILQLQH